MVKAMLVQSGVSLGGSWTSPESGMLSVSSVPSVIQGYGRVQLDKVLMPNTSSTIYIGQVTVTADSPSLQTFGLDVSGSADLKVTVVWTDPPGPVHAAVPLINDVDLTLTSPSGQVHMGNGLTWGTGSEVHIARDSVNNVEQVTVQNPEAGVWTLALIGARMVRTQEVSVVATASSILQASPTVKA